MSTSEEHGPRQPAPRTGEPAPEPGRAATPASPEAPAAHTSGPAAAGVAFFTVAALVALLVWASIEIRKPPSARWASMTAGMDTVAASPQPRTPARTPGRRAEAAAPASRPPAPRPAPATPPVLGSTLAVSVLAAEDRLSPIRATVDDDVRRPYWVEEGDTKTFQVRNRIILEGPLDLIRLEVAGRAWPTTTRDAEGRIVITRAEVEARLGER